MESFANYVEFLRRNGWDIEEADEGKHSVRCSVGDFSFRLMYRSPNSALGTKEELILMLPRKNDEIWSLVQIAQDLNVEVMRCRDPINPELLS